MDLLIHIIPLVCILTIRHPEKTSLREMMNEIIDNEYIHHILIEQMKIWGSDSINEKSLSTIMTAYSREMDNNAESIQLIKSVKELFSKNINNHRELSKLIDKYLVPEEADKKSNAEVSTPFQLRQDMLDKIPTDFWKKPNKIFEPCSGKGGFIIDIIDRFMEGLQHTIPDESIRYRTIVEDCL